MRHGLNAAAVTIVPHANWRGTYGAGTYKNGSTAGILDLTTVHWPADDLGAYLAPTEPYAEDQPWIGGLIGNIRDANGWLYRRNRYYDPATGRFTQEDPIGLAGGLNLYAFGGGDAVSYADPYGLCWDLRRRECREHAAAAIQRPFRAVFQATANFAAGGSEYVVGVEEGTPPIERGSRLYAAGRSISTMVFGIGPEMNRPYPRDYPTSATKNWSARMASERDARNLARTKLGSDPVEVAPNKFRSVDGRWQYRAKPADLAERHIHLEQLNPQTGEVIQNLHLRW